MYRIEHNSDHLLVKFTDDFDCNMVEVIIHHLTMLREYPDTNDIWLIGNHRADIRLGEIETLVKQFHCHCPKDAARTKTALVVDEGLTGAIVELWANGLRSRVEFDIRIFGSLEEAREWLGAAEERVA
jgi:hypothetical protein